MHKQDVISHYGTATKVATAIGVSKATVSLWKEVIPWKYALLIEKVSKGQLKYDPAMYQENDRPKATA
ncbi:hypothetical protein BSU01_01040 [Erwinia billingiae]|jgi:DNA-binding transcriptional regulator YdaS (Cro superfamily)|uniref:Cro/CI family transcriptional regulator n=1 Tax=Erwinia billingiae TaxID=182337 RepID=UPI0019D25B0F|nr:Cro/CI family transcriptional regulator [Erwinia billingiae]MBN7120304.1 hypothetical protein [Erwinia billingiae]